MKFVKKYQQGGPVEAAPVEEAPVEGAPVGAEEQAMQQIMQMAVEIVQQLGPDGAQMLAEAIMQVLQEAQAGVAPVFKKGGKLVRR